MAFVKSNIQRLRQDDGFLGLVRTLAEGDFAVDVLKAVTEAETKAGHKRKRTASDTLCLGCGRNLYLTSDRYCRACCWLLDAARIEREI